MWISVSIYVCTYVYMYLCIIILFFMYVRLYMYVHMYICIIICVCVCRWYKQPTTGHPGREAVLLTVRTAHELCSFLPWAGAVSCVSWTCNRGTTEGEWEHFILLSLIPNPSWEWGQSLFSLIPNPSWEWGQSLQPHSQPILGMRPISTHPGNEANLNPSS